VISVEPVWTALLPPRGVGEVVMLDVSILIGACQEGWCDRETDMATAFANLSLHAYRAYDEDVVVSTFAAEESCPHLSHVGCPL
jgi:hypothetical protein